ncbi:MAG: hypothetical protein M0T83_04560, partial [Nitrospiraceae bacterium]|nr:hypothetical protein [Nitrospiraceae bacterium]
DKADQEELAKSRKTYIRLSQLETEIKSAQTELQLRERKLLEATTNLEGRKILEKELASEEATLLEARTQLAHAGNEDKFAREELERIRLKVRDAEVAVKEIDDAVSRAQRVLSAIDLESRIQDLALQQNLWGPPGGSGRAPSVWYNAI